MSKKKSGSWRGMLLVVVVLVAAGYWANQEGLFGNGEDNVQIEGALVRRGVLDVTVTERGNLTAKNSASVKSEVEGRQTLLFLIEEGSQVQPGDLVAEIDTSDLLDRLVAQQITVQSSNASATKTREALEIQRIENESSIALARQEVQFAQIEIEKYVGSSVEGLSEMEFEEIRALSTSPPSDSKVEGDFSGGNRQQELQQFNDDILIREEERKRFEDTLTWSRQLAKKGFVERTELEADELAYTRSGILLEQAQRALYLLERYEHPKQWARLQGDFREAQRQLRKSEKQAVAKLADYQAAKEAAKVRLELEEQKLARSVDQVSKGKLFAPVAGMVVYGRTDGGRMGGGEPMQEGGEIRERQEIVSIPGEGGMVAEASVHESSLEQVVEGLPVILRVDALPGREFYGHVGHVAVLPDKNSWWANPNLRLYKTEILVDEASADMRPGMSCNIEIQVDRGEDVLYVPRQAVHHSGGSAVAWVRGANGVELRQVTAGRHNDKWLEVVEGLKEGETVLMSPPAGFQAKEGNAPEEGKPETNSTEAKSQSKPTAGGAPSGERRGKSGTKSGEGRGAAKTGQ
jgi:HlyD family secretion protein